MTLSHRLALKSELLRTFARSSIATFQFILLKFNKDKKTIDLIRSVRKDVKFLLTPYEAFIIYSTAKAQSILDGDMAEIGVFQGGSAKLICEAKDTRKLHLFDTFEGLPEISDKDAVFEGEKFWKTKQMNDTSLESVRKYLSSYQNVFFYKGKFPDTAEPIKDTLFSFVHIDVDLYEGTLACLKFFYPRLVRGGIIISHDYRFAVGVRRAFDEFFQGKQIPVIELNEQQCMVIKF